MNIFDNPALIEANPRYLSELQNLPDHERDRQLWGNWHSMPSGSQLCDPRNWFINVDRVPEGSISVRAYDLASTEPNDNNRFPDATTSIRYWKSPDGYYYITGDYHHDFVDSVDNHLIGGRLRKRVGERNQIMLRQAELDGDDTLVIIPIDPSAAGVAVFEDLAKQFTGKGFRCKRDPSPTTKSKLNKFLPFADAAQNGLVHIIRGTFPNDESIEFIYRELEKFDGERSTRQKKDD